MTNQSYGVAIRSPQIYTRIGLELEIGRHVCPTMARTNSQTPRVG